MGDLSRNFSSWEFRCSCGLYKPPTRRLIVILQALRDDVGTPLNIVSGYRCQRDNRRVGGSTNSRHLIGGAADIPGDYCTIQQARRAGAHRIGVRGGRVIHVDDWPGKSGQVFRD